MTINGDLSDDAIAYFERKAIGGAAVVTVGETTVDSRYGKRFSNQMDCDSRRSLHSLTRLTDKILMHGAIPSIELQHAGLRAGVGVVTNGVCSGTDKTYGPSECYYEGHKVYEMPEDLIYETIEKFANAALFAKNAGFGMVTVHGAHGWLINQFMTPRLNRRTDKWGGSVENRARLAVEICDAIHAKCGKGFPVELRISASEVIDGGYGPEEAAAFAAQLDGHANIIHCSAGNGLELPEHYRIFSITHPCMFKEDGVNVKYAAVVKQQVKRSYVATVGALTDPAMMEEIIASGQADIVAIARGLICDPDLPIKARTGRDADIVKCMRCFNCFSNGMNKGHFWCALNPETNRERWVLPDGQRNIEPKKVLVVGGGIGGMEAALTAEKAGHQVILCERTDHLGGHIRCEEHVPFKKHLAEYINQQAQKVLHSGIELRLNTTVTPDLAKACQADVIIAALGASPIKPNIPGIDGGNVLSADAAYISPAQVGDRAVILGGGLVGLELAIYLTSLGKHVEVLEMAPAFSRGANSLHGWAVEIKLQEDGIAPIYGAKATRIDAAGVWYECKDGEKHIAADTVIYAVGQKALTEETMALYDCAPEFYPLGDCVQPRNIPEATSAAYAIARNIGRII